MSNSLENKYNLKIFSKGYFSNRYYDGIFFVKHNYRWYVCIWDYIGANALSATNIVYPVINILIGISIMFATGGNAIVAKYMGEGKVKKLKRHLHLLH